MNKNFFLEQVNEAKESHLFFPWVCLLLLLGVCLSHQVLKADEMISSNEEADTENLHRQLDHYQIVQPPRRSVIELATHFNAKKTIDVEAQKEIITLDRLFSNHEFAIDRPETVIWSTLSESYFSLRSSQSGAGQDIVRVDNSSGRTKVIVAAADLIPKDRKDSLQIEAFQFSGDESKVLIYTHSQRVWRRNTRGDYFVLDLSSKKLSQLGGDVAPSSLMFAKFAPEGESVAYVHSNNIYQQNLSDLTITAVTNDRSPSLINGTSDWVNEEELSLRDCFRFSPDGQSILFWQFDTTGVQEFHLLDNTAGKYPKLISFPYPKVGELNSSTRLGVVSTRGGKVNWLQLPGDPREHYIPQAEWTPDGSAVVVQQLNRLQNQNRVFLYDPLTGDARHVFTEADEAWLENDNPFRWMQSGQSLLWLSERTGWRHAWNAKLNGQPIEPVTVGKFDVIEITAIDEVNDWFYFIASPHDATQRYLYRGSLREGDANIRKPQRITPADQHGWHQYHVSPHARWAIHTWSTLDTPPRVELIQLPSHTVSRVLTDNSDLREKLNNFKRPSHEFLKIDIGDGIVLDGWCLKPSHFDPGKKYPLLIYVYGEPHGTTVTDSWKGTRGLWHEMLAEQGCILASFDNRGTYAPRGRKWRKCVYRKIGILAPPEQAAALEKLLSQMPSIDSKRVGIWGWSGGGSMSLNAIFRYPHLYQTAIAVAPNANQLLYDTIYQERYMGLPSDNAEGYLNGSPLTYANRLRGNLLLVHGTGDDNGHYQGTEFLMNELIKQGKHFDVMPYPSRSHSIKEGENTVRHFWGQLTHYLEEHLFSDVTSKICE